MSPSRKLSVIVVQIAILASLPFTLTAAKKSVGSELVKAEDMKEFLATISSDEYEGRATFTEGLGLAAAYIAEHLKSWGVKPGGDHGSYFQRVRVLGVRAQNQTTVTVQANGQTRTFKNGEGITLPANAGGKHVVGSDQIEFMGYGLDAPAVKYSDFTGKDVKGRVVVFLGSAGPKALDQTYRRLLTGRARYAVDQKGAIATFGPPFGGLGGRGGQPPAPAASGQPGNPAPGPQGRGFGFGGPPIESADFTTVQRLDASIPPTVSAQDDFFEFLFSGQEVSYSQLKAKAADREALPIFTLKNVKITVNIDVDYKVVRTQLTRNIVGIVDGGDQKLKNSYVAFGAHYDHVGYSEGEIVQTSSGAQRAEPKGRITKEAMDHRFWNGADDDGSGTVTMMAVAKAFATGPRPRRSLLFVWHTGEERGLYGSRYFADYPTVPIDSIVAEINMDMVGRDRDNKTEEANTVYVIGSDRISTELHNLSVDANQALSKPLKLDYEMNDPSDLEQFYYRSDHYSYAAKGIPIVFLTTGLHPDYHANTDSAEKINYEKMGRIGQLAYLLGQRVANLDHPPARDNRGARAGKGTAGKLE
jgi:hypothetical protein